MPQNKSNVILECYVLSEGYWSTSYCRLAVATHSLPLEMSQFETLLRGERRGGYRNTQNCWAKSALTPFLDRLFYSVTNYMRSIGLNLSKFFLSPT